MRGGEGKAGARARVSLDISCMSLPFRFLAEEGGVGSLPFGGSLGSNSSFSTSSFDNVVKAGLAGREVDDSSSTPRSLEGPAPTLHRPPYPPPTQRPVNRSFSDSPDFEISGFSSINSSSTASSGGSSALAPEPRSSETLEVEAEKRLYENEFVGLCELIRGAALRGERRFVGDCAGVESVEVGGIAIVRCVLGYKGRKVARDLSGACAAFSCTIDKFSRSPRVVQMYG